MKLRSPNSSTAAIVAHVGPRTAKALRDLGQNPAATSLLEYLDVKLAALRQQNDNLEDLALTRNQGKVLILVELKKLLGVEDETLQLD